MILKKDTQIIMDNKVLLVKEFLGSGGQGEVYKVEVNGKQYALKWYYPQNATQEQKEAVIDLTKMGISDSRFLWPLMFIETHSEKSFGYIMNLRDSKYEEIGKLVAGRLKNLLTFSVLCKAGIEIADCFRELHTKGLCYKDISFGNVFIDSSTGDILICDNDNVRVNNTNCGNIQGTSFFMAPEIWKNEASPSTNTDLYSLSVVLFYFFFRNHPLEGKVEANINSFNEIAKFKLYAEKPIFIFDQKD